MSNQKNTDQPSPDGGLPRKDESPVQDGEAPTTE